MAEATLPKQRNVGSSHSWNCVECLAGKELVSAHFYFKLFIAKCPLLYKYFFVKKLVFFLFFRVSMTP